MNRQYNRLIVPPIVLPIVPSIPIKRVHSSVSYEWAICKKYNRRGHASHGGYGPLLSTESTPNSPDYAVRTKVPLSQSQGAFLTEDNNSFPL